MAALSSEIIIKQELRPCIANDKKALFHRWNERREIIAPSLLKGGHGGGVLQAVFGLVEYEDGTMAEIFPENIRFLDNKAKEYCFNSEAQE